MNTVNILRRPYFFKDSWDKKWEVIKDDICKHKGNWLQKQLLVPGFITPSKVQDNGKVKIVS